MSKQQYTSYEEVAAYLLNEFSHEFGLSEVQGKQTLPGASGTDWEIDGKGIKEGNGGVIVIECRRYTTSKLKQAALAALAFQIDDLGAQGGITVSPLDLQAGAKKIAAHKNIIHVTLSPNSTTSEYVLAFLNKVFVSLVDTITISDSFHLTVTRQGKKMVEIQDNKVIYEDPEYRKDSAE